VTLKRTTGLNAFSPKRWEKVTATGFRPTSTFTPRPREPFTVKAKVQRHTDTGPDEATVLLVCNRDQWRCTCCGDEIYGYRGSEWSISHRKLKSRGLDNRACNLALVCGDGLTGCHGEIHRNPAAATEAGWMGFGRRRSRVCGVRALRPRPVLASH
jgi:hypothetical protein